VGVYAAARPGGRAAGDRDQQLAIATLGVVKQEKSFLRDEQRMLVSGGDFGQDSLLTDQQMDNIDNRVGYNQAAQALDNAKAELRKYTILSPINGVIADREVIQGQWINPGESLCKIYNPKTFEAELYVLENVAIQLLKGQSISIVSISEPKLSTTARITTINPVVNKNGLVKVRAKLASRHNQFYHGMNIKASIKTPTSPSIVIPKEALVNRSNRDVVFTYDRSSGLAQWNYVTVGDINSTHASIIDGLEEGMEVIIEGNLNLGHDANVQVADSESTYE
jgi:RND family efflux transporter MFP subunit